MRSTDFRSLTLEQRVGQLFVIGLPGADFDAETEHLISTVQPGGICLFSRNIREAQQTRDLIDRVRLELAVEPIVSLDQEGGLVDRLRRIIEPMPALSTLREISDIEELAGLTAEAIRMLGFNVNFAPVVDVVTPEREGFNNGLRSRTLGHSADDVVKLAVAYLKRLRSGGVAGCIKHFPGLGGAEVDSHDELPAVRTLEQSLRDVDLKPYRQLIGAGIVDSVMVAHAAYPMVSLQEKGRDAEKVPSSLSYGIVTDLLRGELGFEGVAITDDMEMGAIVKSYGIGEACKMAVLAGEDLLAICASQAAIHEGYDAVLAAVRSGEITEQRLDASLNRISLLKSKLSEPLSLDSDRLDQISVAISTLKSRIEK
jgi:beta-N-acetylhexosaminidase